MGGTRFDEIAAALRESEPQQPHTADTSRMRSTCRCPQRTQPTRPRDGRRTRGPSRDTVALGGRSLALHGSRRLYPGVGTIRTASNIRRSWCGHGSTVPCRRCRTLLQRPEPLEAPARSRHSSPHDEDAGANDAADAGAHCSVFFGPSDDQILTTRFWPPSRRIMRARLTGGAAGVGVAATARSLGARPATSRARTMTTWPPHQHYRHRLSRGAHPLCTHTLMPCRPWTSKPNSATACTLSSRPPVSSEGSYAKPSVLAWSTSATHRRAHKRARAGNCSYWRRACFSTAHRA